MFTRANRIHTCCFSFQIKPDFHSLIGQISQHSSWDVSMTSEEDGGRVKTVCATTCRTRKNKSPRTERVRQRKGGKFSHLGSWNDPNYCDYGKQFCVSLLLCEIDKVWVAGIMTVLQVTRQKLDTVIFLIPKKKRELLQETETQTYQVHVTWWIRSVCFLEQMVAIKIWFAMRCGINNLNQGGDCCLNTGVSTGVLLRGEMCVVLPSQLLVSSLSVRSFFYRTKQDETQTLFQPQTSDQTRNI